MLELGAGYGRDLRFFDSKGLFVVGVDNAGRPPRTGTVVWVRADAGQLLTALPTGSFDLVYSNLFWNMDFTYSEHRRLWEEVRRVLRPKGWHLYSVRAVSDPWYGRGRWVGPDRYDLAPRGTTMHFFSPAYVHRLERDLFHDVELEEREEGGKKFRTRVLCVAERPIGSGPQRPAEARN